jgi:hypothetical protein
VTKSRRQGDKSFGLGTTDLRNSDTVCKVWGQSTKLIGKREVQVLRTWDGGPNGVRWIFGGCGKGVLIVEFLVFGR